MNRVKVACSFCDSTGRVEEFTCPCCLGEGTQEKEVCPPEAARVETDAKPERPQHPNLFNTTPEYAMRKLSRLKTKRQRNTVALSLIGLTDFKRSTDELEGAA